MTVSKDTVLRTRGYFLYAETSDDPLYMMAQVEYFMDNDALNAFWLFLSCIMGNEVYSFGELEGFERFFKDMRIDYKEKNIWRDAKNFSDKDRIEYLQDLWRQAAAYPAFYQGLNFPIS